MENEEFKVIYQNYVRQIFYFLLKLSGNYHIAEELTQETFVKAYTSIDQFRGACQLKVWLCQIAKNLYFDDLKAKRHTISFDNIDENSFFTEPENMTERSISKDNVRILNKYIMKLKEPYQTIFVYRVFEELSYFEIGQLFQKTENWVRVNFYRAKQKLQNMILTNERMEEK